ncbi:Bromodomain-containing factor 1 [Lasiodiplodia hormozganensis]|uniref:Bromodomain-containing factor 1 n=1 Tax=Lasiodiplodia hormozganensis TaxID=869390 RepID=A0AA39W9S7_9PEZI|nr:Bromodomain-containing factor 1 [Lasiodiplodia hormozganensis]
MDKPSVEPKPVPSADAMALDANINGSANEHDPLFDEDPAPHHVDIPAPDADAPSDALPTPATNGDDAVNGADSHHDDEDPFADPIADPITDVESGIAPTAPFLADLPLEQTSLPALPENLAPTSLPSAVEPATSDVREDSASVPQTSLSAIKPEGANDAPEDLMSSAPAQPSAPPAEDKEDKDKMDGEAQTQSATTDAPAAADVQKSDEPTDLVPPPPPAEDALQTPAAAKPDPTTAPAAPAIADQEMTDAPSANKTRPREDDDDDDDDGPLAKRVRTADGSLEPNASGEAKQKQQPPPPITNGDVPPSAGSDMAVTPPAISNAPEKKKYDSQALTPAQHKFLMDRLRGAKKTKPAVPFLQPVDPVALNIPHYPQIITRPMDLSSLETKHKERRYQSVDAFMDDFYLMIDNCVLFNGPQHPIAQSAWNLQMWFERGMHLLPGRDAHVEQLPKKPKKSSSAKPPRRESRPNIPVHSPTNSTSNSATFALQADGTPLIRRDSSTGDGRPKREIHRPPPKDLPYSNNPRPKNKKSQLELRFAEMVINEMMKPKYRDFSYPFLQPVDPVALNIPQYLKIIKRPMDLGTVHQRFKRGEYTNAKDVKIDLDLIFANCYKFNPEGDDVNKMGKMLEEVYRKTWDKKTEWMEEHAPASEPASESEDDEEEDSDDDENEEEIRRRQAEIAEQIMKLTQEQLALQAKKGKSPKVAAKKGSKKDKSQTKSKKLSKHAVPAKPKKKMRQITFEEKRLISETISNLDEVQMAKAVQIIRNGVPALQGVNDDELELDIDTIPNDVLHDLLKYIKTVNPAAATATAAVATYDDDYEPPSRKNTAAQPRKNKPMGKHEQEQAIAEIKQRLQNFNNRGSSSDQSPEPVQTTQRDDSSDDESSASESEEE